MHEAERLGMESLPRQQLETVTDELPVFGIYSPLPYLGTVIAGIIEKRMSDPIEMHTYLMRASGLETALHHSHIAETLQHAEMSDGMLAAIALGKDPETHAVIGVTAYVSGNRALVLFDIAPDYCHITALD